TLNIIPIRIDWHYTVIQEIGQQEMEFKTLGSFPENIEPFRKLIDKWLKMQTIPPITRLAFGAVLLQPVETRIKGYEVLAPYLPALNLNNASDLVYQINRPRKSWGKIAELEINRLSKWAVLTYQAVVVPNLLGSPRQVGESYASHLELDISTPDQQK